jgi:hypothetical protein
MGWTHVINTWLIWPDNGPGSVGLSCTRIRPVATSVDKTSNPSTEGPELIQRYICVHALTQIKATSPPPPRLEMAMGTRSPIPRGEFLY